MASPSCVGLCKSRYAMLFSGYKTRYSVGGRFCDLCRAYVEPVERYGRPWCGCCGQPLRSKSRQKKRSDAVSVALRRMWKYESMWTRARSPENKLNIALHIRLEERALLDAIELRQTSILRKPREVAPRAA